MLRREILSHCSTYISLVIVTAAAVSPFYPYPYYSAPPDPSERIEFVRLWAPVSLAYQETQWATQEMRAAVFGSNLTPLPGPANGVDVEFVIGLPSMDYRQWSLSVPGRYQTDDAGADFYTAEVPYLPPGEYRFLARARRGGEAWTYGDADAGSNGIDVSQYGRLVVFPGGPPPAQAWIRATQIVRTNRVISGFIEARNSSNESIPAPLMSLSASRSRILSTNGAAFQDVLLLDFAALPGGLMLQPRETRLVPFYFKTGAAGAIRLRLEEKSRAGETMRVAANLTISVVTSMDPNEKRGPEGKTSERLVPPGESMQYVVKFENLPTADASAQIVEVQDVLDPHLDPATLRFDSFGFDSYNTASLTFSDSYHATIPIRENLNVEASITYDPGSRTIRWLFESIDPATGAPPDFDGFLPPNDVSTGSGEGYVAFSAQSYSDAVWGEQVQNEALIWFDDNPPISTALLNGPWVNTIGYAPPEASRECNPLDQMKDVDPGRVVLSATANSEDQMFTIVLWEADHPERQIFCAANLDAPYLRIPFALKNSTAYQWQVIVDNEAGSADGPVWTFTTAAPNAKGYSLWGIF